MDALDGHLRGPVASPQPVVCAEEPLPVEGEGESKRKEAAEGARGEGGGEGEGVETIAGVVMVGGKGAGRRALIEYVMLAGVNDTKECGRELGELLKVSWDYVGKGKGGLSWLGPRAWPGRGEGEGGVPFVMRVSCRASKGGWGGRAGEACSW